MVKKDFIQVCHQLIAAYKNGKLGQTVMPEDAHPDFVNFDNEFLLIYFTLPMALNYQRDSYKLWEAAQKTFLDSETRFVFNLQEVSNCSDEKVRKALSKYKLALQPNKHIQTWKTIAKTIYDNWGSIKNLIQSSQNDFLLLKKLVTIDNKKGFPYLSGPKIFYYWSFILTTYAGVDLLHRDQIEIAPDTHITQCSVKLGVINQEEASLLTKDEISQKWRMLLKGSDIDPIDMHAPLWFWSRNGFIFSLPE